MSLYASSSSGLRNVHLRLKWHSKAINFMSSQLGDTRRSPIYTPNDPQTHLHQKFRDVLVRRQRKNRLRSKRPPNGLRLHRQRRVMNHFIIFLDRKIRQNIERTRSVAFMKGFNPETSNGESVGEYDTHPSPSASRIHMGQRALCGSKPAAAFCGPDSSPWCPYGFKAHDNFDAEGLFIKSRDAAWDEQGCDTLYRRGFYYPTGGNQNEAVPEVFCAHRCLKKFPHRPSVGQQLSAEGIYYRRQEFMLNWNDAYGNPETYQPCSKDVRLLEWDRKTMDTFDLYRGYSGEPTRESVHHVNFFGRVVYTKSATTPAATIAILSSNSKWLAIKHPSNLRIPLLMSRASRLLDPVLYYGDPEILRKCRGSRLEEAVVGQCVKFYSEHGWWSWDRWADHEDRPNLDPLDANCYDRRWTVINGCTQGFPSRAEILAAGTEESAQLDRARTVALQARISRGPVRSRLGFSCVSRDDLQIPQG